MTSENRLMYATHFEPPRVLVKMLGSSDLKYDMEVPAQFGPGGVILHMSCNTLSVPHIAYLAQEVLTALKVDFAAVGGPENCCGSAHWANSDDDLERQVATLTLGSFKRAAPTQVVSTCPDCDISFERNMKSHHKFVHLNLVEMLAQRLDDLKKLMVHRVDRRVVVHAHRENDMRRRDADAIDRILRVIPGVEVIESKCSDGLGNHCLVARGRHKSTIVEPLIRSMFQEAKEVGADTLVVQYHGCYRQHLKRQLEYGVEVSHYLSLVADSIGIPYEETFKTVRMMNDLDAAVEYLRPQMSEKGFQESDVRTALKKHVYV